MWRKENNAPLCRRVRVELADYLETVADAPLDDHPTRAFREYKRREE